MHGLDGCGSMTERRIERRRYWFRTVLVRSRVEQKVYDTLGSLGTSKDTVQESLHWLFSVQR